MTEPTDQERFDAEQAEERQAQELADRQQAASATAPTYTEPEEPQGDFEEARFGTTGDQGEYVPEAEEAAAADPRNDDAQEA